MRQEGLFVDRFASIARPYCAAFMLIERDGKYLFVRRANTDWMDGYYGLPSGKVEKKEGFLAAAIREAREEVGVVVTPQDAEFVHLSWRDEPEQQDMEWCDVLFRARVWSGEPYNAEPHMHDKIAWFSLAELPVNTVPPVKAMLEAYFAGEPYSEFKPEAVEK